MPGDQLIESLRAAVAANPSDPHLRLHLAELLPDRHLYDDALRELGTALAADPGSEQALELIEQARKAKAAAELPAPDREAGEESVDWELLDSEFEVEPMFVESSQAPLPTVSAWDVERETVTLADVGGLEDVKERLQAAFLEPLRNPELRKLYAKDLRGGLMLYGPPGCGKGFIARALAGEIGAAFIPVAIDAVLDMWVGNSERNLHDIFMTARRSAPAVIFFDEIDALGRRRSQLTSDTLRTIVNQLLAELDGLDGAQANQDVFTLAATNHPWDVDPALRRPGRFDRTLLVLPPDEPAREVIFRTNLKDRPVEGIDLGRLARLTDGYSGADIKHICDTAAEKALIDAVRTKETRLIGMNDLQAALKEVQPSVGPWFDAARNVVTFANQDGSYDELKAYMKRRPLLGVLGNGHRPRQRARRRPRIQGQGAVRVLGHGEEGRLRPQAGDARGREGASRGDGTRGDGARHQRIATDRFVRSG
jgi:SpoVK/Ycf46/Vps4 family AAA+-type ATPase